MNDVETETAFPNRYVLFLIDPSSEEVSLRPVN